MNATATAITTTDGKLSTEILAQLSIIFVDHKVTADNIIPEFRTIANQYIYSYTGDFAYMLNLHYSIVGQNNLMTDAQAAGALNCAIAGYRYSQRSRVATAISTVEPLTVAELSTNDTQIVRDGTYTIVSKTGGYRTIRLQTVEEGSARQWLSYLCGSDNDGDYKSVGFVNGSAVTLFAKYTGQFADILAASKYLVKNADRIGEFGKNYAVRSGKCWMCNRTLTTPESVTNGIGPVCATKL